MEDEGSAWSSSILITATIISILFFKTSSKFRYLVKWGYLLIIYNVVTPFIALFILPWPKDSRNGAFVAKILKPFNSVVGVTWELEGVENLSCSEGAVVILNHQSALDLMALFEIWPPLKKAAPIAKRSILYISGFFGLTCWLVGCVFIDRTSKTSRDDVNSAGKLAMSTGTKLLIFPEGTRNGSKGLKLLPFKKGAFHVAIAAGAPIIPVVVSEYDFLDYRTWKFDAGHAVIRVLPSISTKQYTRDNIDDLINKTQNQMQQTLVDLAEKKDK